MVIKSLARTQLRNTVCELDERVDGGRFAASLTSPLPGEIDCFVELVDLMAVSLHFTRIFRN